jgi:mono/diheme cytochrome c family protein
MLEQMREMHQGHEHEHDFEAIGALSPEEMNRAMDAMMDIGLAMPPMNSHRGRELFLDKGCIVCHQVNGVGGEVGPPLNAQDMPAPMNAFEFAARMWRGAGAMIAMQQELFGDQIELNGQDLADLVAFAHDRAEQAEVAADDIPEKFRSLIDQ